MLDFSNIITSQMIPRMTGDALVTKGFEMVPIMLKSDHLIEVYRNIIITLAK